MRRCVQETYREVYIVTLREVFKTWDILKARSLKLYAKERMEIRGTFSAPLGVE